MGHLGRSVFYKDDRDIESDGEKRDDEERNGGEGELREGGEREKVMKRGERERERYLFLGNLILSLLKRTVD